MQSKEKEDMQSSNNTSLSVIGVKSSTSFNSTTSCSRQNDKLVAKSSATNIMCNLLTAQEESQVLGNPPNTGRESQIEESALPYSIIETNLSAKLQGSPQSAKAALHTAGQILDLCTTIYSSTTNAHLDYLMGIKKQYFRFFLGPKSIREKESSISLQELLEGDSSRFPPAKRVLVATILASSLLQLQRTQWIKDCWSKRDVFFRARDGMMIFEQLYFSAEFASSGKPGYDELAWTAVTSETESTSSVETNLASINQP